MKQLFLSLFFLFLSLPAWADGKAFKTQDCGLSDAFTATKCGNVGDPWEGAGQPASTVTVSSLPQNYNAVTANAVYRFSGNLTAADSTCANGIQFTGGAGPLTIDLNGTTYTGVICIAARYLDGLTIINGTVNCSVISSGTAAGCIRYLPSSGGAYVGRVRTAYLTVTNSADPGAGAAAAILFDVQPASCPSGYATNPLFRFDHITVATATGTTALRISSIRIQAQTSATGNICGVKFDHNKITLAADSSGAQGMEAIYQYAPIFENNYCNHVQNTTAQSGRCVVLDTDNNTTSYCTGCAYGIVRNNWLIGNNGRTVRNRGSAYMFQTGNTHLALRNANGAVQMGDATSPQGDYLSQGIVITGDTFEIYDGGAIWGRGITGVLIRNNVGLCHASGCTTGRFLTADTPTGVQATTTFDLQNNVIHANVGTGASCTGGSATKSCAKTTTTVNACSSGTFSGAGTVNATTCP